MSQHEANAQAAEQPKLTLGQYRVGIDFNPSQNEDVSFIKQTAADAITFLKEKMQAHLQTTNGSEQAGEIARLYAHAMTMFEDAAMRGVKAVTKKPL